MEKFRKEVMCFMSMEDHIIQHEEINVFFKVECDTLPPEKHLSLHLELMYYKKQITKETYNRYKNG